MDSPFPMKTPILVRISLTTKTWGGFEPRYIFYRNTDINLHFLIYVHYINTYMQLLYSSATKFNFRKYFVETIFKFYWQNEKQRGT